MKLKLFILLFLSALVCNSIASAQDEPPYIYYYSPELNAMIVERADGTDTRVFGQGMNVPLLGPGWSPNGEWFASSADENLERSSSIISPDGSAIRGLSYIRKVFPMYWSPDGRYILVSGSYDDCRPLLCSYITYLLIGIESNDVLATVSFFPSREGPRDFSIEWSQDNESVSFYMTEDITSLSGAGLTRVTMYSDGEVVKRKATWEEYELANPQLNEMSPNLNEIEHISPDGRYSISAYEDLTDHLTGAVTELPRPEFPVEADADRVRQAQWDASGEWVLLGYGIATDGFSGLAVMRADGSEFRTLNYSLCWAGLGGACAGWLPDNVDVDSIPLLADAP